jgi:NAD(P)-dependent dehydrogenase (short-subunit alcohol dehydrogenase family)
MPKIIFITGATSGIGFEAALALAADGNHIIATARSIEKGNILINAYKERHGGAQGTIEIVICDLTSFESIVAACKEVRSKHKVIDTVINNAGVWNFSYRTTKNNIEEILQVNVLAPLLINDLLFEPLSKSDDARTIFAASGLHQGNVNLDDLEFKNKFSGFKAYRQSKLEVILLCRLLAKKWAKYNIGVYCEHPGFVSTGLGRDAGWFANTFFKLFGIAPAKGAETLIYLARQDKSSLVSGEYYYLKAVKKITPQSYDMETAEKLLAKLKPYLFAYANSTASNIFL